MNHVENTVAALRRGDVVLVPTDTNYALAADPWNEQACKKIFDLKKRDMNKPLTLFVAEPEDVWRYTDLTKLGQRILLEKLVASMPGAINLVVPKSANAPAHPFIKPDSVSIVCNKQSVLREVIRRFGRPLGMSSANLSGIEATTLIDIEQARETFGGRVGYILPASETPTATVSSTIVSLLGSEIETIRAGDINVMALLC